MREQGDEEAGIGPCATTLIEIISVSVRGGNQSDALIKACREQARDNHRIGYVTHFHLVKTQHAAPAGQLRVATSPTGSAFPRLAGGMDQILRNHHEIAENAGA